MRHVLNLLVAPGNAHHVTALDLRDLSHGRADRAGGGRDDYGLPGPGPAYVEQPEIRRQAGHSQHTERRGDRRGLGIDSYQRLSFSDRILLPTQIGEDHIPFLITVVARLQHTAHNTAHHELAELDRRRIGFDVPHPASHIRVHREVDDLNEAFSVSRRADGRADQSEVRFLGKPLGPLSQRDLPI